MSKIGFIFPGQGAQYVGMGKELFDNFESAKKVFHDASDSLGIDIEEMIFDGTEESLAITENTQPTILTVSIAAYEVLRERGIVPHMVAGLSLGEYSAHVVSGSLDFKQTISLVRKRGKFMQEAVPVGVGTMAAILGLEKNDVVECCKQAADAGIVEPANFNCPGQIVVAGEIKAVEKVCEIAKEKGAKRAMLLPVSAPFHCSMLAGAGQKLAVELEKVDIYDMNIPVVTNVTAKIVKKSEIEDLLIRQVSSSVLWEECINTMLDEGIDTFVEVGPGKALSGFVKKINKDVKILNVEDLKSLENTLNELK